MNNKIVLTFKFIDYNDKDIINEARKIRSSENPIFGNLHYTSNFMLNTLNSNHNNLIGKMRIDDDRVLAFVRKVSLGKAQYYRCSEYPVSFNKNKENEDYVFNLLFESKYIEQAYVPKHFLSRVDKNLYFIDSNPSDSNFFSIML